MNFSAHLAKALELSGLTPHALGKKSGVSHTSIARYLAGDQPKQRTIADLAAALNISTAWLTEHEHLTPREYLTQAVQAAGGVPEVARKCGIREPDALRRVIHGGYPLRESLAQTLASGLRLDLDRLLSGSDEPRLVGEGLYVTAGSQVAAEPPTDYGAVPRPQGKAVPLLGVAQAGPGNWDDGAWSHEAVVFPTVADAKAFAVKVTGDSMSPHYLEGDLVLVYPSHAVRPGGIALVGTDAGERMIKIYQRAGDQVILSSYNPAYPPLAYPQSQIVWAYPVASMQRPTSYFLP